MAKASGGVKKGTKKARDWREAARKIARHLADSPLPAILLVSSFILARWWKNSDFSYPSEIVLPIVLFGILSTICFYGYRLIFGKGFTTHIATLALSYSLYAYDKVEDTYLAHLVLKLWPDRWTTELSKSLVLLIFGAVLFGALAWGLVKTIGRLKRLQGLQLHKVVLFAILFLFVLQVGRAANRLWDIHRELSYHYPAPFVKNDPAKVVKDKPDIYFLMPEDYADSRVLQQVNMYDNSSVLNFLDSQGFTNKQPVYYSNYPFTMSSLASNLAMSYFPEFKQQFNQSDTWQTGFPYRSVINDPPIAQILKRSGYQYNQVSSWWDFTRVGIKADTNPSEGYRFNFFKWHFFLSDLSRDMVHKSILAPWLKKGLSVGRTSLIKYDRDYNPRENLDSQLTSLKAIAARADKSTPQFSFGHFMIPHTPFIFDADGSMPDYDGEHNDIGAAETLKYANQVAYFNTQIKSLVSYIRAQSPSAVIIIQSDEGSYPPEFRFVQTDDHFYDPINLPVEQMKQKFSIFASYLMPGVDQAAAAKQLNSPVNTFRFVLDQYLGYSLPMLPDCHFTAGNKFQVYNYQLVTDRLTGSPAAACRKFQ